MLYEKILLDEVNENVFIEAYIANNIKSSVRKAIVIMPGGGYSGISPREAEPIAIAFMAHGYNAFILNYSVKTKAFPTQLIEASLAIKYIRENAEKYNINPDKVFVAGFSAGGHLAASIGTMWHRKDILGELDMPYGYNRPNGMMLIYPVISAEYHKGSFVNLLLDKKDDKEMLRLCSLENAVDENTCPAFIAHSSNDQAVKVQNSLVFADELAKHNIQFEMHIYPDSPHGFALGNEITMCGNEKWCNETIATWVESAVKWADELK